MACANTTHTYAHTCTHIIYIRTAEQGVPGLVTPVPASMGVPVLEGMDAMGQSVRMRMVQTVLWGCD